MIQEDKDLLLKDLCARLPYGVIIEYHNDGCSSTRELGFGSLHDFMFDNAELKPYLRPMLSMTKEELREYNHLYAERENNNEFDDIKQYSDLINWLLENQFDFMGLIPKGLALEAPENMYLKSK